MSKPVTFGYSSSPGNFSGALPTVGSKKDKTSSSCGCFKIVNEAPLALLQDIVNGNLPALCPLDKVKVSLTGLLIVKAEVGA